MSIKEESASVDDSEITPAQAEARIEKVNDETNFFKFLRKDFEDLSLGPIKKAKTHRKRIRVNQDGQTTIEYAEESREESEDGSQSQGSAHYPVEPRQKMENKEAGQEDAAAAWRAQRAQKSCLHSDKPEDGGKKTEEKEWSTFEATWRVSTLPFRLMRNSVLSSWKPKTRPSWSSELEQAVTSLRTYITNTPLNISMVRMIMDRAIPTTLPENVTRLPADLGSNLKVCWSYPASLRHQAEAARFILYLHGPESSPSSIAHKGLVSRLALECHAAVVTVDYRRSPDSSATESLEDIVRAYKWLATQPAVTPAQLLVMADGLGANLAMSLVAELRDSAVKGEEDILPAACAFISPWVDLAGPSDAALTKSDGVDYLSKRYLSFLATTFAGLMPLSDPAVSPINLPSFKRFPPTLISAGQFEALAEQAQQLGTKLRESGVKVEVDEAEDQVHSFQLLAGCHPACAAGILRLAVFARRMSPGHMQISTAEVDALIEQASSSDVFKPPDEPAA